MNPKILWASALMLACGGGSGGPSFPEVDQVAGSSTALWSVHGRALSRIPDTNGDGVAELLVASDRLEASPRVDLISGLDGRVLWTRASPREVATARLEDLDADGTAELLLSTRSVPEQACTGDNCAGDQSLAPEYFLDALTLSDGASRWSRVPDSERPEVNAEFLAIDDDDGDGIRDLVLSAPFTHELDPSPLQIVSGATGAVVRTLPLPDNASESLGTDLVTVPDLDADGREDLLVADPRGPYDRYAKGRITVLSTATGAILWQRTGDEVEGALLYGDVNALLARPDGAYPDVITGAHNSDSPDDEPQPGLVEVLEGRTGAQRLLLIGRRGTEHFGLAVADVGDVNGDGVADIGVGAPMPGVPVVVFGHGGRVAIHSGTDGALLVDLEEKVAEDKPSNEFGITVHGLGIDDGGAVIAAGSHVGEGDQRREVIYAYRSTP